MSVIVSRIYLQGSTSMAADLARYGSDAQWHGVYYRGEKIGFTVRQVIPAEGGGYELQEDGRLQMSLLGATTTTRLRTTARVDERFDVRSPTRAVSRAFCSVAGSKTSQSCEVPVRRPVLARRRPRLNASTGGAAS